LQNSILLAKVKR